MVLVDASVWIDHFRASEPKLVRLLNETAVLIHPAVIGEVACGNLKNRAAVLEDLASLPKCIFATDEETLSLMEERRLWGRGIGWVDTHLLAAALLSNCALWTRDARLAKAAHDLRLQVV